MSTIQERNKAVVARFINEGWGKLSTDVVDECCADEIYLHYPLQGEAAKGKDAVKATIMAFKALLPDLSMKLYGPYGLIAERDYVFARWVGKGKHTGPGVETLLGYGPLPENSGRVMHLSGMTIFTLKDGKIVKEIGEEGAVTGLQQLELLPEPAGGFQGFVDHESA